MNASPLKIEYLSLAALRPYERNARTHSAEQVAQISASMREFGWTNPILIDEAGVIIAGHGRLAAAQKLGFAEAPVIRIAGLSDVQRRALTLADNKLALNAGWDQALLIAELKQVGDLQGLVGFSADELMALLAIADDGLTDAADEIPETPAVPITQRGDIWHMGNHRIICGDATSADDVARVLEGRTINVAFTSPPYAEQREYDEASGFHPIPPAEYVQWFKPVAGNVARHLAADGSWFINIKPSVDGPDTSLYVFDLVIAHVREWGWHFATEFCWERIGVPKSVHQRFKNQFEPIYQFARGRWKMRPDKVRHESENVPQAGGPGSGDTNWKNEQGQPGSVTNAFGAVKKRRAGPNVSNHQGDANWQKGAPLGIKRRRNGTAQLMSDVQGIARDAGEFIGPGLAYPGNRLPTFTSSHTALGHAAAFPVGLPDFFCKAFADAGDVIFDPFCGTGSTLIAAEHSGCIGVGCEISPAYVDVIVARWEKFTGRKAERHPCRT